MLYFLHCVSAGSIIHMSDRTLQSGLARCSLAPVYKSGLAWVPDPAQAGPLMTMRTYFLQRKGPFPNIARQTQIQHDAIQVKALGRALAVLHMVRHFYTLLQKEYMLTTIIQNFFDVSLQLLLHFASSGRMGGDFLGI